MRSLRFPLLGVYLLALLSFGSAVVGAQTACAEGRTNEARRSELILTNLPPKGSRAYNDLLALAGKDVYGQVLGFTKSEVWSLPSSRVESVTRQGERVGVYIARPGRHWNQILNAPVTPVAMSSAQETLLRTMGQSKETTGVQVMASPMAAVVEYALMKDHDPKSAIGTRPAAGIAKITIPLSDRERIVVRRTGVDMRHDGCTWRGAIEETGEPVMIIWWRSGKFTGMFTYHGRIYTLMNLGGELRAVVETDPGRMPPDHGSTHLHGAGPTQTTDVRDDPLVRSGEGSALRAHDQPSHPDRQYAFGEPAADGSASPQIAPIPAARWVALAAKPITIDLMVLYTPHVASKYLDVDADLIHLAVEQANNSFVNSGVGNIKLRVVYQQLVDYDESDGEHFNHLYRMVDGEGVFANVRALRDDKRADIVALIVDDPSGCGLSTRIGADADAAFVVVHHSCAALTYSIAHEVGHILGARHDIALDRNTSPFPYGHGYVNGTKWRDIMSYKDSCGGCPRIPYWSNPRVLYKGEPTGTAASDNARVILEQAERVSKFR
jgi:hypothetical protein